MSRARLLGVRETQGTFEGKPFHSVKLHIAEPFYADNSYGEETSIQSVKYERLPYVLRSNVPGLLIDFSGLVEHIGEYAEFQYDKNGSLTQVIFDCDAPSSDE